MQFRIKGVNSKTSEDVDIIISADSAANAKVKAELQGVIVTEIGEATYQQLRSSDVFSIAPPPIETASDDSAIERSVRSEPPSVAIESNIIMPPEVAQAKYTKRTCNIYAGFWRWAAAFVIDYIILYGAFIVVAFCAGIAFPRFFAEMDEEELKSFETLANCSAIFIFWFYFAGMESSAHQATVGKRILRIKVTTLDGSPIGFGRATGRHFAKFISGLILGIGYLIAAFTPKKQTLHDMMAGCLVVKRNVPPDEHLPIETNSESDASVPSTLIGIHDAKISSKGKGSQIAAHVVLAASILVLAGSILNTDAVRDPSLSALLGGNASDVEVAGAVGFLVGWCFLPLLAGSLGIAAWIRSQRRRGAYTIVASVLICVTMAAIAIARPNDDWLYIRPTQAAKSWARKSSQLPETARADDWLTHALDRSESLVASEPYDEHGEFLRRALTNFDQMLVEKSAAESDLTGDSKAVAWATTVLGERMRASTEVYAKAKQEFLNGPFDAGDPSATLGDLEKQIQLGEQWRLSRIQQRRMIDSQVSLFRDMITDKVGSSKIDTIVQSFSDGLQVEILKELNDANGVACDGFLYAMKMLRDDWGHWSYDRRTDAVRFNDDAEGKKQRQFETHLESAIRASIKTELLINEMIENVKRLQNNE